MSFDREFIDMMVPHHEAAVAMSELAAQSAQHAEIKSLASDMIRTQTEEVGKLRAWRKDWFGSEKTPGMDAMPMLPGMETSGKAMPGPKDMTKAVEKLKSARPFDKAFLAAMTEHHQAAIEAAKLALHEADRAEIKTMARKIVAAQGAEVATMAEWMAEWD